MGLDADGYSFEDAQRWAKMAREKIEADIVSAVQSTAKQMQTKGRTDHLYKKRTGNLNNAIIADVEYKQGEYVSLSWYIKPDKVMTEKGWNYGWIQNDGSYSNYRQGAISPQATPKSLSRKGVRHDDFMGRAWNGNIPKLQNKIANIFARLV
jgi:hypothetical protein